MSVVFRLDVVIHYLSFGMLPSADKNKHRKLTNGLYKYDSIVQDDARWPQLRSCYFFDTSISIITTQSINNYIIENKCTSEIADAGELKA